MLDAGPTGLRGSGLGGADLLFISAGTQLDIPARLLQPAAAVRDSLVQNTTFGSPLGG